MQMNNNVLEIAQYPEDSTLCFYLKGGIFVEINRINVLTTVLLWEKKTTVIRIL